MSLRINIKTTVIVEKKRSPLYLQTINSFNKTCERCELIKETHFLVDLNAWF